MLGGLEDKPERFVIVDLSAGVPLVVRGEIGYLDAVVVVVEPYVRSAETAKRLLAISAESGIRRIIVANKIRDEHDLDAVRRFLGEEPDLVIPADASVSEADKDGQAPADLDPPSPAIHVVRELASQLTS